MLNFPLAMLKLLLPVFLLFFAQASEPAIFSPQAGGTLRGRVEITGNLNVPNFASAELAFSYASDPNSWFLIQTFSQPPANQTLTMWDTSLVTDGDYVLHLRILFQDGSSQDVIVSDLKIRNDVPLPTETPTPAEGSTLSAPTTPLPSPTFEPATPTSIFPTPTNLPPNPVTITSISIFDYFARGGLIAVVLIACFGLILRLRKN